MKQKSCHLCQSNRSSKVLNLKAYNTAFWQCSECDLVYLSPQPNEEDLTKYYEEDYYISSKHAVFNRIRQRLRKKRALALKQFVSSGRVLEIGCAQGEFLEDLKQEGGFEVFGVEKSAWAADQVRKKGIPVQTNAFLQTEFENDYFDLIMGFHVIEHVRNPSADVVRMYQIIKKDGYLILSTPNYESLERQVFGRFWYGWQIPYHLFIFSTTTLRNLLRKVGFKITRISFSYLPNDWAGSLGNLLGSQTWGVYNPLILSALSPLGIFSGLTRRSGRITIVAQKV